jgi:hypothetical protein
MKKIIKEGLDYHDLEGQLEPKVTVDEYAAKMGDDSDIVTLTFVVKSNLAAEDLVAWLELGYDYVLDASVSEGELEPGKWLVFVEMKRKPNVPKKIIEILEDLKTLTNIELDDWTISVDGVNQEADEGVLKHAMILSPSEYKQSKEPEESSEENPEDELNEMREIAGLPTKKIYTDIDEEIKKYISNAGL